MSSRQDRPGFLRKGLGLIWGLIIRPSSGVSAIQGICLIMDSEGSDSGSEDDTSTKPPKDLDISSGPYNRLIHAYRPEVGQQVQVYVSEHCVLNYFEVVRVLRNQAPPYDNPEPQTLYTLKRVQFRPWLQLHFNSGRHL